MTPQLVEILANIAAAQARIEAMKAENAFRESRGFAQAYDVAMFFAEAKELAMCAEAAHVLWR